MWLCKPNGTTRKTWVIRSNNGPQITLPTKNKKEAERILATLAEDARKQKFSALSPAVFFEDLRDWDILRAQRAQQKEKNITRGLLVTWNKIIAYDKTRSHRTDVRYLDRKYVDDYELYRRQSKRKPQLCTIKREVEAMQRALIGVSVREKFLLPMPSEHWPSYRNMPHTVKLSQKGKRIDDRILFPWLESLEGECKLRCVFLVSTGMRREECEELTLEMLEHPTAYNPTAYLDIPAGISKIKKARRIPISKDAYNAIRDYVGSRKSGLIWSRTDYRKQMAQRALDLGYKWGIHCRDLRHTFCNTAMQNLKRLGINVYELSKYVGHKGAEQMNKYISPNDDEIAPVIAALSLQPAEKKSEFFLDALSQSQPDHVTRDLGRDLGILPAVRRVAEDGLKCFYLPILFGGS